MVEKLFQKVMAGERISKEEAKMLLLEDSALLAKKANEIRVHFCKNSFDLCTIVNGKSGNCSEDCKFCAQSSFYPTSSEVYSMLSAEELLESAKYNQERNVLRYSIVTSGRRLSKNEMQEIAKSYQKIADEVDIKLCASHGLLDEEDFALLKKSGVIRYHNNLESSRNFFPNICTKHSYDDKIRSIRAAQKVGLEICSGGIWGLGESAEDRLAMAFELRELGVTSIPINILQPIAGTPFEKNDPLTQEEIQKMVAIYRFIHPTAAIRLAGGRALLDNNGREIFQSGANAAITGDMLTTTGSKIAEDVQMIEELGFEVEII